MGLFDSEKTEQIKELQTQIAKYQRERKFFAQELAVVRNEVASLTLQLQAKNSELVRSVLKLKKLRERQKSSVERANRYKTQLDKMKSEDVNLS
ncbi:hypothetical protein ACO0LM_12335 [Undibacterium sp. Di26W]|uniref:hypothetical protein n=1 Tax=Undibacterium sp. Di26W TaxID=3413035 RepID=UPI003BF00113